VTLNCEDVSHLTMMDSWDPLHVYANCLKAAPKNLESHIETTTSTFVLAPSSEYRTQELARPIQLAVATSNMGPPPTTSPDPQPPPTASSPVRTRVDMSMLMSSPTSGTFPPAPPPQAQHQNHAPSYYPATSPQQQVLPSISTFGAGGHSAHSNFPAPRQSPEDLRRGSYSTEHHYQQATLPPLQQHSPTLPPPAQMTAQLQQQQQPQYQYPQQQQSGTVQSPSQQQYQEAQNYINGPPLQGQPHPYQQPVTKSVQHPQSQPRAAHSHPSPTPAPPNQIPPGGAPARRYLNEHVTPTLLDGMKMLAREQPKEPLLALAKFLEERHQEADAWKEAETRKEDVTMEDAAVPMAGA